jgi:tRNA pseudouridine32 synthase/23S rRNA pseudouridine746 synthase
VFDYLQPDGYFRQEEGRITALNHLVTDMEQSPEYIKVQADYQQACKDSETRIVAYQEMMRESKLRRDACRNISLTEPTDGLVTEETLIKESQFQKAELRRLRKQCQAACETLRQRLLPFEENLRAAKQERHQRSDALQRWLFDHFLMLNAQGETKSLTTIFSSTPQRVPPAGSGECCAPKLLQYAFLHQLQPLCIAEFWQGRSPRAEIRHHGQFYPACRGKCKPILEWMLPEAVGQGGSVNDCSAQPRILYTDTDIAVVEKPAGLLSVPGRIKAPSVQSVLAAQFAEVYMPHRLDMDTSGLMVVALNQTAYHHLQRQFLARVIYKRYIALLDGLLSSASGTVSLPLRPDLLDRPRQVVDPVMGKEAITDYRVLSTDSNKTLVELTPHTGRTHQLRVHCAHADGLAIPIVGDPLYGKPSDRLHLHAAYLSFLHPATGQRMEFSSQPPF